jgi:hypothetical protein
MTFNADAHGHLITQRAPSDDEQTPAQREQRADDRFDELWNDLKARIRASRGERDEVRTFGEGPLDQQYGATVSVWEPDEDEDGKLAVTIGVSMRNASVRFATHRDDLINIAAHCLGAVADMDELNNEQQ